MPAPKRDITKVGVELCRQAGLTINSIIRHIGGTPLLSDVDTGRLSYKARHVYLTSRARGFRAIQRLMSDRREN